MNNSFKFDRSHRNRDLESRLDTLRTNLDFNDEVYNFLKSIGHERYYHEFKTNGIEDMETMHELSEQHLEKLGINIGHRLKILKRLKERKEGILQFEKKQIDKIVLESLEEKAPGLKTTSNIKVTRPEVAIPELPPSKTALLKEKENTLHAKKYSVDKRHTQREKNKVDPPKKRVLSYKRPKTESFVTIHYDGKDFQIPI